ncbi:MAG TPA: ABC transporter ATP-binding protein [Pseudogracilibacillus sp.]|nr:ABC transporter ATP-binding protein [Pseudogracilibacillus sp.]
MLHVTNVTKRYGGKTVVDDVEFTLHETGCVALIGPNGAGKTTIMRMLTNSIKRTSGTFYLFGEKILDIRPFIGYLPQQPVFYPWMTAHSFLTHCAKLYRIPHSVANERMNELLATVDLYDVKHEQIRTYSGGMKQRLGIAQALFHRPKILLLDEPVSALDPLGRKQMLSLMMQLKSEMSILFSTHILNDAEQVSDAMILLQDGAVVEAGTMNDLREKYATAAIELHFSYDAGMYERKLQTAPFVKNTSLQENMLTVVVTDVELARQWILHICNTENWPLTTFAIKEASLEEMFMKVVERCNG